MGLDQVDLHLEIAKRLAAKANGALHQDEQPVFTHDELKAIVAMFSAEPAAWMYEWGGDKVAQSYVQVGRMPRPLTAMREMALVRWPWV